DTHTLRHTHTHTLRHTHTHTHTLRHTYTHTERHTNTHAEIYTHILRQKQRWALPVITLCVHREGVQWEAIDWMDNAECLDLIEKKLGMLALVNEESRFPKGTDFTLLEKLHSRHSVSHTVHTHTDPHKRPRHT
uniref:Myosin motor domain-containing protein n=1 Tax=Hucho hucho TaxID=62062 RepID=A0A4W5MJI5_9TELE